MSTWTTISDSRVDADSPVTESLVTDLRENTEYNLERAVRSGTHAAGVRLAIARGVVGFSGTTDSSGNEQITIPVTYSSGAADGNPNFGSPPTVIISLEEDSSGGNQAWSNFQEAGDSMHYSILDGTADDGLGFDVEFVVMGSSAGSTDIAGFLHWVAFGPVTGGE